MDILFINIKINDTKVTVVTVRQCLHAEEEKIMLIVAFMDKNIFLLKTSLDTT